MKIIIILVAALVLLTLVRDAFRKQQKSADAEPRGERLMTANEAPPTETGRMRAQFVVEEINKKRAHEQAVNSEERENEQASEQNELPDPFDTKH